MVVVENTPVGDGYDRQPGLFNRIGLISVLLILSLLPLLLTASAPINNLARLEEHDWLYRREAGLPSTSDSTADILVVGDVMLGRGVAGVENPFRSLSRLLATADLTVGNFEGVISAELFAGHADAEVADWAPYRLIAPVQAAADLQQAGFDLLSLANNHSLDLGVSGLAETLARLNRAGIKTIGAGLTPDIAYRPVIVEIKGLRIAFLAFDAIAEPPPGSAKPAERYRAKWQPERLLAAIRAIQPVSDAIIILAHWGDEYEIRAGLNQRRAAEAMLAAGADAVIGSHPHVVQETQVIDQGEQGRVGFVAYSLGNFVFDQYDGETRLGLALRLFLDRAGLRAVEALPVAAGVVPHRLSRVESQRLLARIRPQPAWLSFQCDRTTCSQTSAVAGRTDGLFKSGQTDLNGDGRQEIVRLAGGRVSIFEGAQLKWESPPDWQILDAALGDPNDDGRSEVVLALRKPDSNGNDASHPFVIGHRGGIYRQVWGGSAVVTPILEIELVDLDGDGQQELIVLEGQDEEARTISVWRWDEWVFRLVWRSAAGRYTQLQVIKAGVTKIIITVGKIR